MSRGMREILHLPMSLGGDAVCSPNHQQPLPSFVPPPRYRQITAIPRQHLALAIARGLWYSHVPEAVHKCL
jgi:hypothetical protein